MSGRWATRRARLFASDASAGAAAPARRAVRRVRRGPARPAAPAAEAAAPPGARARRSRKLVGQDLKPRRAARALPRRLALPALTLGVALALGVAALRLSILRARYDLASAAARERSLLEEERDVTVAWQELRDPRRLKRLADERGFVRPERRIVLPAPEAGR